MSWRTVIISNRCKLSYKNNYMIIRNEDVQTIHLSEINIIVIDTNQVSITTYLINEIVKRKIKIIFCDEQRNPSSEIISYYGAHNTSKKIFSQIKWDEKMKDKVWKEIVKQKIIMQATVLKYCKKENYDKLMEYSEKIELGDKTNREGHSAKVYFNTLFGKDFNRNLENVTNAALDYGYAILLSTFNKEIVSKGYLTQLGLNHKNEFNFFNLSCDLMEPFRPLIDIIVFKSNSKVFDKSFKYTLINVLNLKIKIAGKQQYLSNAITIYLKGVIDALEKENLECILNYEL